MGSASSSQSGSASFSVHVNTRSRLSKLSPSEAQNTPSSPSISKPSHSAQPAHHQRHASTGFSGTTTSTKLKERQAWYRHLRRLTPSPESKAKKSALIVRSLIIGQPTAISPKVTTVAARPQLIKIKSHLLEPKYASPLIAELRTLPPSGENSATTDSAAGPGQKDAPVMTGPIHAVCLQHPDAEVHRLYFSKSEGSDTQLDFFSFADVGPSVERLSKLINDIHVVDLIKSPDFGLGQPGNGPGILAGAVPTPGTVINGFEQITPQLMTLGFAIGKTILPDHKGIFPPTDRMSVLTYWWGLELVLPPPSLAFLASAHSVSGSVMNFLTALSMVNNGVREILPLIRYISQFVDFEFDQIQKQDQGKGVICAATWIMPAALVPRPWDFPDPPMSSINPPKDKDGLTSSPDNSPKPRSEPTPEPTPASGTSSLTPAPVTSILDAVTLADASNTDTKKV